MLVFDFLASFDVKRLILFFALLESDNDRHVNQTDCIFCLKMQNTKAHNQHLLKRVETFLTESRDGEHGIY